MKERVLHISKRYPPYIGGIETYCHDMCEALKGEVEQKVIAFNDGKNTITEIYDGVEVTRVGVQLIISSQPLCKDYKKELYRLFKEFKPTIVIFHYPNPFAAHYLLKAMKKFKYNGKFILSWICDIIKQRFLMKFFDRQNKKLLSLADKVTVITPTYLKDTSYLPYYDKDYFVLPCCISEARTHITKEQKELSREIKERYKGKKICFFYGRHIEYKGLKYLIEADNYLDNDKVQIVIAGSGPLTSQLKDQAKDKHNIDFVGRLTDDEINAYLMACYIFTFPSITRNEAFGISLAEAMYFGKPTVTFEIKGSGVNWVSIDGETGLVAKNRDAKDYANKINVLINNKDKYLNFSENSLRRSESMFSSKTFNNRAIDLLKD